MPSNYVMASKSDDVIVIEVVTESVSGLFLPLEHLLREASLTQ